jgi:hypothetical protein
MSRRIQIALPDPALAQDLRGQLLQTGELDPICLDQPDFEDYDVLVVDAAALGRRRCGLARPERVVAVVRRDTDLGGIWEQGIRSVVFDTDPIPTIALAVQAAMVSTRGGGRCRSLAGFPARSGRRATASDRNERLFWSEVKQQ